MTVSVHASASTRDRLIEASGELFAQFGFRDVTVRQICQRANANIAAVNYHFRDKEGLYREVVLSAYRTARERYPMAQGVSDSDPAEKRLKAFIRGMLGRIFDEGTPPWGRLLAREMVDPTPALDGVVEEGLRPQYKVLANIVREVLGSNASEDDVRMNASSVVGQVVVHHTCKVVIQRLFQGQMQGKENLDALADHITAFSMAAMTQRAAELRGRAP